MKSKDLQVFCYKYNVQILYTAGYYPRADHTESVRRVIKTMLNSYVQQAIHMTWEDNLSSIACIVRTFRHEITVHTPNFILLDNIDSLGQIFVILTTETSFDNECWD